MSAKRRPDESFDDYKKRQKEEAKADRFNRQRGWWVHKGGTYNREEAEAKRQAELAQISAGLILVRFIFDVIAPQPVEEPKAPAGAKVP